MMKPPIEVVRVSDRGKEILIKIKKRTGLQHWNEICRIALCHSLIDPNFPSKLTESSDNAVEIEWKTFAGSFHEEIAAIIIFEAQKNGINLSKKEILYEYFKSHLEHGITNLKNISNIGNLSDKISF